MSDLTTFGGTWRTQTYQLYSEDDMRGCEIELLFRPNDLVNSSRIGLTQSVTPIHNGGQSAVRPEVTTRSNTAAEGDAGRYHDRAAERTNPIYGMNNPRRGRRSLGSSRAASNARWGSRTERGGRTNVEEAYLYDQPKREYNAGDTLSMTFETTAVSVRGPQQGTYYGSVEWGFRVDATGQHTLISFRVVRMGAPSAEFMASAQHWNDATVDVNGRQRATQNLPITSHRSITPEELARMSDQDLEARIQALRTERRNSNRRVDRRNAQFEIRALEREARRRAFWHRVEGIFQELLRELTPTAPSQDVGDFPERRGGDSAMA